MRYEWILNGHLHVNYSQGMSVLDRLVAVINALFVDYDQECIK